MSEEKNFDLIVLIEPHVVKALEGDDRFIGHIEGVASTPDVDLQGDKFLPEVLERNAESLKGKPILLLHGKNKEIGPQPVGEILEARFENGLLKIKAGIYKSFQKIWDAIKNGILKALSIGGIAKKFRKEGNVTVIEDAEIKEVSLTPRGVNPLASIIKIFGKSLVVDDGFLREVKTEDGTDQVCSQKEFEKVDYDLPIVKRESWDGDAAAARIFKWAEKEDGSIDKSKASKLFLVVEGDGSKRGDYSWPVGDIVDGKPVLVSSGIITAIKYASGARGVDAPESVKNALERLVAKLKKEGVLEEDYEVPWKRKSIEDRVAEIEKSLERLEKALKEVLERFEKQETKIEKSEDAQKKEVKAQEKGLASQDEAVRKVETRKFSMDALGEFKRLWRELGREVSD